jgi:serine/threonine protein kinase
MVVIQLLEKFQNNEPIGKDIDSKLGNEKYELFIGHFKIVAFLSEGAFGKVYKGVDLVSSRPVAIKLISIEEMMRRNKTEHIREKLRRYLQTEEILMKKCHSAFVVKLYETY